MNTNYLADEKRYETMKYRKALGNGLKLPSISIGLWHNFGGVDNLENMRKISRKAFDLGVTYFDLANNYGPPPGSAEENFGRILKMDFGQYRDELFIATKAGYHMWPGPYGEWGSRKYLLSSLDASLKRMGLEYVDLFYSHRFDPDTPLEETMGALAHAVHSGKAMYVGISNYGPDEMRRASKILKELGVPCLVNQVKYSLFHRPVEDKGLIAMAEELGISLVIFSPLAQGLLTNRYLNGIPEGSRATKSQFLKPAQLTPELLIKITKLNELAKRRNQNLSNIALAWVLRHNAVVSALVGASSAEQIADSVKTLDYLELSSIELKEIELILKS